MSAPTSYSLPVVADAPSVVPSKSPYSTEYWMSVEERLSGPPGLSGEFPDGSTSLDPVGRRDFVKLLGASMALAGVGLTSCSPPRDLKMVPFHKNPDGVTIGNALHYASALSVEGVGVPVLVTAREGRPIKVDGNPDHPSSSGASGSLEQAALIQMYDPHRAKLPKAKGRSIARKSLVDIITARAEAAAKDGGARVRFLLEPSSSLLVGDLIAEVKAKLPKAKFVSTTPISQEARHEGTRAALGAALQPVFDFSKATVVLSLDDDFLFAYGPNLASASQWAKSREPGKSMSRLYVVEPSTTVTGSMADHRLRLRGSQVEGFARALAAKLGGALGSLPGGLALAEAQRKFLDVLAEDLRAAGGTALVVAGERQPVAVHALATAMNAQLGSIGTTVTYVPPPFEDVATGPTALKALLADIDAGAVETLVITARNPAWQRWADLDVKAAMAKVTTFTLGLYDDETAAASTYFFNEAHALESWGDAKALDGSILLQQPIIEPLYNGVSQAQFFAMWAGRGDVKGLELLKASWVKRSAVSDTDWGKWLQLGFIPSTADAPVKVQCNFEAVQKLPVTPPVSGLELALVRDYKVHDGAVGNLAWLQELPDPITKLVWDNAALVSPRTAESLGVKLRSLMAAPEREVKVLRLTVGGASVEAPICILPGHADDAVTLALGYGRRCAGEPVADGVGADAYRLRRSTAPSFASVTVEVTDRKHPLTSTQEHWDMHQRKVALERPLAALTSGALNEELASLRPTVATVGSEQATAQVTLQAPADYEKAEYKWALSVDLNRCTGCSACITACQAENNIPVVGRENVQRNREMFWMRIDRYFGGDLAEPSVITQPVTCQQCETAPCEYVCPVNATVHSDEGLNDMIYNRCIGTRYCSNNCPYKVRRFNYFHYTGEKTPVERLAMNPEVTVRSRGVMEKCTFCVQRIESARIETRREKRKLQDGDVKTACQQACPTQALTFGDLHDSASKVSKAFADPRAYVLVPQLGVRPRTRYLARIKNPNPKLQPAGEDQAAKETHG